MMYVEVPQGCEDKVDELTSDANIYQIGPCMQLSVHDAQEVCIAINPYECM